MKKQIYLDHAATTPVREEVFSAMEPWFSSHFGNPSGVHQVSRKAAAGLSQARRKIAKILDCTPGELIFTSGGTESDNLAIRGVAWKALLDNRGKHIITSAVEHYAVEKTISQLCELHGFEQTVLPVDSKGAVDPKDLREAIRPDTILISIVYASSEVGTIQPIAELSAVAAEFNTPFHVDAVQAGVCQDISVKRLGVDLLTLSAHKVYGPKGAGLLYLKQGIELISQTTGGSHEKNHRAGTENIPAIAGFATALELAQNRKEEESKRLTELGRYLIDSVLKKVPNSYLTGSPENRSPGHVSFVFEGIKADTLLMHLDMAGICASSGSACATGSPEASGVLLAMGLDAELSMGAIRFTLGLSTKKEDIDYVIQVLPDIIQKIRTNY